MTRVVTTLQNFSRGRLDHNMMGRFDLPIYANGADVFENFITNFQGNAKFRPGFEEMLTAQDGALAEFKFNVTQNYILFFYGNSVQFAAYDSNGNFGWVLSGGVPLVVTTPYSLAESKKIQLTQNSDVMVITHPNYPPYELTRTSATTFTMLPQPRKDDPFSLTWASTKTITAITQAKQAQMTIATHGYSVNDRFLVTAVAGMTQINNYTVAVVQVVDPNTVIVNLDTTAFTAYSSGGASAKVLTGNYPACCCFYKGRLWFANTATGVTTMWASQSASYHVFTIPTTPVDTDALKIVPSDISSAINWLFAGDNSLIVGSADGILAVNGGDINTAITPSSVSATLSTAPGSNSVTPVRKDGLIFYVGTDGRNAYYFAYNFLSARFEAQDANFISYDITEGGINKIRWKKDRDDLVFGIRNDGELLTLNFNEKEKINGWHNHSTTGLFQDVAVITDNVGKQQCFVLAKRAGAFYIERSRPYVEFALRSDFLTDDSDADNVAYIRYVAEQLKQCNYLDNGSQLTGLQTGNSITFTPTGDGTSGTIAATSNVFSSGNVGRHIVYQTASGYESGRFIITAFTDAKNVTVDVLQTPTVNTYANWYLSFNSVSGLTRFNGQTVSVVADGGYYDDFAVSSGTIALNKEITCVWIGYSYLGMIKSFSMGFASGPSNTQSTIKNFVRFGVRVVCSAGLEVGSDPYNLEPLQQLSQNDLNYLPPIPMDGTEIKPFVDVPNTDKFFYIAQNLPLPATIAAIMLDAEYAAQP